MTDLQSNDLADQPVLRRAAAITAAFSVRARGDAPVEDGVRALLAARYLEPRRVRAQRHGGSTFLLVEQPGTNEAEAAAILDDLRALAGVTSAELECRLERPAARLAGALDRLKAEMAEIRIDVV